jgi:hypothetical protein
MVSELARLCETLKIKCIAQYGGVELPEGWDRGSHPYKVTSRSPFPHGPFLHGAGLHQRTGGGGCSRMPHRRRTAWGKRDLREFLLGDGSRYGQPQGGNNLQGMREDGDAIANAEH